MRRLFVMVISVVLAVGMMGCATGASKKRAQEKDVKISQLSTEVNQLEEAKRALEEKLAKEIMDKQILLELANRGLVITMANDVLFDSGKAKLKHGSYQVLKEVASVIKEKLSDRNVGIEGHTDNAPIKYSGWKSNWELSSARATNVVHYLVDECGMDPSKISAIGCGEYRPIGPNDTPEGMARNRRVEIIVLSAHIAKKSYEESQSQVSNEARAASEERKAEEEIK